VLTLLINCYLQVRDLESELELAQRREREYGELNKKLQRQLAELRTQSEDDRRQVIDLSDTVNTLQLRIVAVKRQLEESVSLRDTLVQEIGHRIVVVHPVCDTLG
jgi:predicted  nucleic acid-binding Zn-ribbon protein